MSGTLTLPRLEQERVVIIGCGFAGLKLARTLDSRQYQTVVFDRNNYHTFQPLMYQVATDGWEPDSMVNTHPPIQTALPLNLKPNPKL